MPPAPSDRDGSTLAYRQLELDNGLRVILHEDRSAPLVAVNLWYHVGSKNERAGRTGFAHLFEHMLFQGSENVGDDQHFALIQQRGGSANGSTSYDRTNYYETLPASELELALWLESDRMGFFLGGITQEKLDNQREVVKNERRFRVDNQPYGTWLERGFELLFPVGHPYRWPVIGYMEDLDAARLEDVQEFFRTFYVPNNCVLTVAGDVEEGRAEELVRRYFGEIPRGAPVARVDSRFVPASRERRLVVPDRVPLPRLFLLYAIPAFGESDYYALDFASDLLSSGRSSRLYRQLVYQAELAKDVTAFTFNNEEVGTLAVVATARPGVELERLAEALDHEIEQLRREPARPAEMSRALNRIETAFLSRLESAEYKADLLSMYATYFDDPGRVTTEIERYRSLTAGQVQAAAAAHLDPGRRVHLTYVPEGTAPARAAAAALGTTRAAVPASGAERPYRFPRPQRARLPSGLQVVSSRVAKVPAVALIALVDAGSTRDPEGQEGLAALTASLLDEGTRKRSSMEVAEALEALGASLSGSADLDAATLGLNSLSRTFAAAWEIAAEVLSEATFPEREVERIKQEQLAQVLENRSQPGHLADDLVEQLLYRDHPYAHSVLGNEESLQRITRADVQRFAARLYHPATVTLVAAGDLDAEQLAGEVERRLGGWQGAEAALPKASAAATLAGPGRQRIHLVDRPGAAQSELRLANLALPRKSADFIPAEVLNGILGGKFTSRINLNLRERHGYTYGARSWFAGRRTAGHFGVATAVMTSATAPALREIFAEIDRIRAEPVGADELDDTSSYLAGIFPLTVETSGELVGRLAEIELYGLPDDYFDAFRTRVRAVTVAEVQRLAQTYLRPEEMVVLVVGDAALVSGPLGELGEVVRLDERGAPAA